MALRRGSNVDVKIWLAVNLSRLLLLLLDSNAPNVV
jgi:hypothetical protein